MILDCHNRTCCGCRGVVALRDKFGVLSRLTSSIDYESMSSLQIYRRDGPTNHKILRCIFGPKNCQRKVLLKQDVQLKCVMSNCTVS